MNDKDFFEFIEKRITPHKLNILPSEYARMIYAKSYKVRNSYTIEVYFKNDTGYNNVFDGEKIPNIIYEAQKIPKNKRIKVLRDMIIKAYLFLN